MITEDEARRVWGPTYGPGVPMPGIDDWGRMTARMLGRLIEPGASNRWAVVVGTRTVAAWRGEEPPAPARRGAVRARAAGREVLRSVHVASDGSAGDDQPPVFLRSVPDAWLRPERWPADAPRVSLWHLERERLHRGMRKHLNGPAAVTRYRSAA